ncbi:hypothetical protein N2152v2_001209 [Parachlorella kessleri]
MCLCTTATSTVCDDLRAILRIEGCEVFRGSINRPNLYYEVVPKPATAEAVSQDLSGWIQSNYAQGESGIVYCLTRKDCEALAGQLSVRGISCMHYHADMDPEARQQAHSMWSQGHVQVIVATIAFGMGINKSDVRFVVHHSLSKSVENYYQESSRAGRDGLPAHCRLYYRLTDYLRQAGVVVMESSWERHLSAMLGYAAASTCRRSIISRHFGEAPPPCHNMCDICKAAAANAPAEAAAGRGGLQGCQAANHSQQQQQQHVQPQPQDVTAAAVGALSTLDKWPAAAGGEKRATLVQLVDKWRSNKEGGHGAAAKVLSRDENELVVQQLLLEGCLLLDFGFTAYATNVYLKLGPRAATVLQGKRRILLPPQWPALHGGQGAAVKPGSQAQVQEDAGRGQRRQGGREQPQGQQLEQEQQRQQRAQQPDQGAVVSLLSLDSDDDDFQDLPNKEPAPGSKRKRA